MKINDKLQAWLKEGLISQEQLRKIQDYEGNRARPWVSVSFLVLGVAVLGLGVISIIASNWDFIDASIKLISAIVILYVAGSLIFDSWQKKRVLKTDLLILFFIIFYLASLGLISQIYNLSGPAYHLLLFWSLMVGALVFFAQHMVVSFTWLLLLTSGLLSLCMESPSAVQLFNNRGILIALTLTLASSGGFFTSLYFNAESGFTKSIRLLTVALWCITIFTTEMYTTLSRISVYYRMIYTDTETFILTFAILIFAMVACLINSVYSVWQNKLLCITMVILFGYTWLPYLQISNPLVYACGTMTIIALGALLFASLHRRGYFNFCVVLLGIRFLILYFQALGGLASTGLGLILAGAMIILIVKLWLKYQALVWLTMTRWQDGQK